MTTPEIRARLHQLEDSLSGRTPPPIDGQTQIPVGDPKPVTHDYGPGKRCWGHDFTITRVINEGQCLKVTGWGPLIGPMIRAGDYLILDRSDGRSTRYQVQDITYCLDPSDMWEATLAFAPRQTTVKE